MTSKTRNIVVVGKSEISTAILHAFSRASPSPNNHSSAHQPISNGASHTHNHDHDHSQHAFSSYNLTLLTRPHQEAPALPKLHHHTSDYALASLTSSFSKQHLVISTIAPSDIPFQKRLIDAAIAADVKYFVPCEFSYDTQNQDVRNAYPPCAARYEALEYLRQRCKNSGMRWIGIATGAMLESGLSEGLLGCDLTWKSATVYGTGGERWAGSTLEWVGELVERLQGEVGVGAGEYIYISEFLVSQNEMLAALEEVEGKKWDVIKADVEECVREGERRMEKGFFDGAMMLLERNVLFGGVGDIGVWEGEKSGSDGRLRDAVRRVVERIERDGRPDCGCG